MVIRFGQFILDEEKRELSIRDEPIHVSPKAFDLLVILTRHAPRVLHKDEIYEAIWPDTIVEPANLNNLVSELRAALGDQNKAMIRTKPRFGYGFAAEVERRGRTGTVDRSLRLLLGDRIFELEQGRNLVGREDDCLIIIDSPEISRHHAVIEVSGDRVTIEDLGSKNGTFVGGEPVESPRVLEDRAEIGLGRTMMRFRNVARKGTTVSAERRDDRQ